MWGSIFSLRKYIAKGEINVIYLYTEATNARYILLFIVFQQEWEYSFKTVSLLENITCKGELFYHKFLYNYLCTYCTFILRHSDYYHRRDRNMLGKNNNL